jgi:hypothetical protein
MIEVAPAGRGGDARGGAPQRGDRAGADTPTGAGSQIRIHGLSMATVRELGLDHLAGTAERLRATRRDSPAGPRIRLTLAAEDGAEIALLGDDSGPNAAVVAGRRLQAADSRQGRPSVLLVHAEEHHTVVPGEQVRLGDAAGIGADARHDPQGAEAWTFLLLGARLAPASDGADGADGAVGAEVRRASFDWIAVRRVE